MIVRQSYTHILLGLPLLFAACSADNEPTKRADESECDEDELDQECECDDGTLGETFCNGSDLVECGCTSVDPVKEASDASRPRKDGSTPAKDASAARDDASAPDDQPDASEEDDAGDPGDRPAGGNEPKLPEISGECPQFKSGKMTIGGLADITVEVGAKKSGGALVFYWHGTGSRADEYIRLIPAAVRKEILDEGGIIISPQGSTNKGADCSGTAIFKQGDFEIADLIAACAVKNNGVDPRRIYTTGCSAGGLQAACMAAHRSSYVAAAVPNSGGMVFPQQIQDKAHVPALMTMHGGAQDRVGVEFSQTSKTAGTLFKNAGGFVVNCNHGGGHCRAPSDLYAAGWEFMKAHPFDVDPKPYSELPSSFPDYCSIY